MARGRGRQLRQQPGPPHTAGQRPAPGNSREDSEACSEGVAGQVEVAEPATGSTLMGETGCGASGTSPSGVCWSMGVKLNSSPEPESS